MRKTIIAVAIVLGACDEPTALSTSPELSVRAARPVPTPPPITVASLGTLSFTGSRSNEAMGLALNNGSSRSTTRVAGFASYDVIHQHPMTWTLATGMVPLKPDVPMTGWAKGVSDNGIIVGEVSGPDGNRAFFTTASSDLGLAYLPLPPQTTSSSADAISADGACIVGRVTLPDGGHSVFWRNASAQIVGAGAALSVSDDCTLIAGTNIDATVWRWNGSAWIEETLPFPDAGKTYATTNTKPFSRATDLSPSGEYVAGIRVDSVTQHAVVWQRVNGAWVLTDMPGASQTAWSVDNSGRAVGTNMASEPMLWTRSSSGSYTAQRLPPLEKSTIGWANAINELGQITGRIRTRKGDRAVLWTIN